MRIYDIIDKKRNSKELTRDEIAIFINGYTLGEIPDYQISALLMAICLNGMTDNETAANVNQHDDNRGNGVALDELGGTVHSSEEVSLALNLEAAFLSLLVVNRALVQVGVDSHLLTGHGVQRETRRNFRHALGAFGYDDKIDDNQNDKHDETDDGIASDDELTKSRDDFARVGVNQNQSRGGNVQCQSEKRRHQQQRREDG